MQRWDEFILNMGKLMSLPGTCDFRTRQQLKVDTMTYDVPTMSHQVLPQNPSEFFRYLDPREFYPWIYQSIVARQFHLVYTLSHNHHNHGLEATTRYLKTSQGPSRI